MVIRLFAVVLLLPVVAFAGLSPSSSSTIVPGEWTDNFVAATNYVVRNDMPLVMVWGMNGCNHCKNLSDALATDAGLAWARQQNIVFCHIVGTMGRGDPIWYFASGYDGYLPIDKDAVSKTPVIRFYWPDRKSERFTGQEFPASSETYPIGASELQALCQQFERRIEELVASVDVEGSFAAFPMGDGSYPCDRLEATDKTGYVDVPIVRTNATGKAAANKLVFDRGGNRTSETISWKPGQTMQFVRYGLATSLPKDEHVVVSLEESNGSPLATTLICGVGTVENSPKNPYWIGERTEETLNWGEWSMDLDVVTNKVKAYNAAHPGERAYAMMFVGGSTWCPDCAMAEENFFSKQAFKVWANDHKVVFGVLDIPNNPQVAEADAWPSQLRYESSRASDAFVSLRGTVPTNDLQRYQSGAGYLSRHSVPYEMATNVAARNAFLMGHDTLNGGWNRPERTNKNRTGVPVLILLRDDGTVAARWNRFSDVGPAAYSGGYLRRFEEMMAQLGDGNEESDDDQSTTVRTISGGESVDASVSSVDQADVYEILDVAANDVMTFGVQGGSSELKVSVLDAMGSELSSASGDLGFAVTNKFRSAGSYFVKVAPKSIADGGFFGYTNEASTVCAYSLSASGWASCGEFGFVSAVTNVNEDCGEVVLSVVRANGSAGAASVRVSLAEKLGEHVDDRIEWTDDVLSWGANEPGIRTTRVKILPDGKRQGDLRLCFRLTDATKDQRLELVQPEVIVNVYDIDYVGKPAYRFVAAYDIRAVPGYQGGDAVEHRLVRGKLPEGIDLYAEGGEIGAMGYATAAAGTYSAVYAVVLKRGGAVVSSEEMAFRFEVIDYDFSGEIPSLKTVRTYGNLPIVDEDVVQGLLTVTVPPDGRLSAKYVTTGKSFSYVTDGWSSFDRLTGTVSARLEGAKGDGLSMDVVLDACGGSVTFVDPVSGVDREVVLVADPWPREGAKSWRGQYTVQMPQTNMQDQVNHLSGAAYMALRMVSEEAISTGSMLYAGVLPNGRAVYGCATLSTNEANQAVLPFYHVSDLMTSPYEFSGGLLIDRDAASNYRNVRWSVFAAPWTPRWLVPDGFRHSSEFNVYGGFYDAEEVTARYKEDFEGKLDNFAFIVRSSGLQSGLYGTASAVSPVLAEMTEDNAPRLVNGADNPQEVELAYSGKTGVVRGCLYLPFSTGRIAVLFRGVALPGWQGCSSCSASGSYVTRPWAVGSCSFHDGHAALGVTRSGCEVRLDMYR